MVGQTEAAMVNIAALEAVNQHRWDVMHVQASRLPVLHARAAVLCADGNKARYQGVTDRLVELAAKDPTIYPTPWWFTAIASEREYGGPPRWDRQLGQGDPLHQKSVHVPAGMGPYIDHPDDKTPGFDAWTRCCVDVLLNSAPHAGRWHLWTPGGVATIFEEYNGLGYAAMGKPSAYVWSGSDQYQHGKYIRDRVYSDSVVDVQEGCMPLLASMMAIDPSIQFAPAVEAHPAPINPQAAA
jgi:lysozyme family protein